MLHVAHCPLHTDAPTFPKSTCMCSEVCAMPALLGEARVRFAPFRSSVTCNSIMKIIYFMESDDIGFVSFFNHSHCVTVKSVM